jgi:hypothetical protein
MDEKPLGTLTEPPVAAELRALVLRAQTGDATTLPRIRTILDEHPAIWRHVGDLSALAERAWIAVLSGEHPLAVESMKRTVTDMKADLAGKHPTRMEQMLVDQVVGCWMEVKYLETAYAEPAQGSLQQAGFRLKRRESAQKRYLAAVKTLTTVRALTPAGLTPSPAATVYEEPKRQMA